MTVPILQIPLTVGVHTKHTGTHTAEHLPLFRASVFQASSAVESELWHSMVLIEEAVAAMSAAESYK